MVWTQIPLIAQVARDESELAAKPFYVNARNMRSVNEKMETTYGQELVTSSALTGICRGSMSWSDLSRNIRAAFGTHLRLQTVDSDGILTDITPVIERGELSSAFSVSSGSNLVTVRDDGHNLAVDQKVYFPSSPTVGDITISGPYAVASITTASGYTFYASSTPTLTASSAGGTVIDYEYSLKPGNQSNLNGLGYGVGGFGSGTFGGSTTAAELDARTWSMTQWGQNLIANPNWGAIYEWSPNTSASELVTSGDFAASGTWTFGSGWSLGAGSASASAVAGNLTQPLALSTAAWHLVDFDVVRNAGTVTPLIGSSTIGAVIAATGTYKRTFFGTGSANFILQNSGAFNGTVDNVSVKVLTTANALAGAPSSVGSVFITAERNLVACGATRADTGSLDPMHVRWTASENNQDWTASVANVAGSYTLSHGSRIVRGMAGNRENLIFTDTAVYRMRSVPDPGVVYAFDLIGEGCGLIGPNAVVQVNGMFFWVSRQNNFMMYQGGLPTTIDSPSERDFNDNLADAQGQKIYAYTFSGKTEVGFIYPDEREGIECSRNHVFNYQTKKWVSGAYPFTSYMDAGLFPYPITTDANGYVRYQEKGFDSDGSARSTILETSYFNIAEGDTFTTVNGFMPDFDNLLGGVSITFYSKNYPQDTERTYGPFNVTANTKRVSMRIKGRQLKYKITTNAAPSFYRCGAFSFDLNKSGQKR